MPVRPADVDELGHVNNTVYLRWVQEVATAHWQAVASAESQAAVVWVVMRHEIDYKAPALPGDEVLLRTWVGKATRLTSSGTRKSCMPHASNCSRKRAHFGAPSARKRASLTV